MLTFCVCFILLSVETSFHHIYLCLNLLNICYFCHCHHTFTLSTNLDPAYEPVEPGSLGEPRVCSTPPSPLSLSATTGRRTTRRSASTESELLDKMCEQSDNSAQMSDRLERLLTSMEAQTNDRTAWAGWMSSVMVKIHEDLCPTYQMCSMDLLNQTLKESKLLSQRDNQSQELDRQQQLDDRQK